MRMSGGPPMPERVARQPALVPASAPAPMSLGRCYCPVAGHVRSRPVQQGLSFILRTHRNTPQGSVVHVSIHPSNAAHRGTCSSQFLQNAWHCQPALCP